MPHDLCREGRNFFPHIQAALTITGARSCVKHTKFLLPDLTVKQAFLDRHPQSTLSPSSSSALLLHGYWFLIPHSDAYLPSLASTLRSEHYIHDPAAPLFAKDPDDVPYNCLAEEGKLAFAWQFSHTLLTNCKCSSMPLFSAELTCQVGLLVSRSWDQNRCQHLQ